jgi:hypothetical protein
MPEWQVSRRVPQESVGAVYRSFTTFTETSRQFNFGFMTPLGVRRIFSAKNPEDMRRAHPSRVEDNHDP